MSRDEQKDSVFFRSKDHLQGLHNSTADPLIRSRPLSDIYPVQSHAERTPGPYLLSGCGGQVQPVSTGLCADESRINGMNSSPWSNTVVNQAEGKPYSSRIMRLFSNSRKGPVPQGPVAVTPSSTGHSTHSNNPQLWTGFSGLGMVDSFKKLRSSVLQGIQNKGASNIDADSLRTTEATNGSSMSFSNTDIPDATNNFKPAERSNLSDRGTANQMCVMVSQYSSDIEDYDDEETDLNGFARNTRFSRSIKRAYGPGRIMLLDTEKEMQARSNKKDTTNATQNHHSTSKIDVQKTKSVEDTNVKVLSRLSKSAENLHIFKLPVRRKAPSQNPPSPQEDPQSTVLSKGTPNILRTSSASSVDLRGRKVGPVRKLLGSMTDLSVRHRQSRSPSPSLPSPMSPSSRLHDDYSRRLPCQQTSERQRRPVAVTVPVNPILEHTPLVHSHSNMDSHTESYQVIADPLLSELPKSAEQISPGISTHHRPLSTASDHKQMVEYVSLPLSQKEASQSQEQAESHSLTNEASSNFQEQKSLFQTEELASSSSSPSSLSESPVSPTLLLDEATASTEAPSVKPRRKSGRTRPRPISDYVQLVSRKPCIPEEVGEAGTDERTLDPLHHENCSSNKTAENCSVNMDVMKDRPVSAIGAVDLLPELPDCLPSPLSRPPIPSHQVPPYKGVSARFRPSVFSQSTPIGLDRVGRRKLHRVCSDGISEHLASLDDSVSEEEESSFDELNDGTPYLQPGVELSALNEWISSGHTVYAEALWDHVTMEEQELAFTAGDVIRVLDASHTEWWWGRGADKEAWFPSTFVRVRVNQEDSSTESVESIADQEDPAPRDTHVTQHREQMRTNVVQEILNTERIYIKHLKDICEGYIRQCRKNPDMFTDLQLKTIFSNIEEIYKFQRQFLRDLEKKYNKEQPHLSEIGSCFLLQGGGFSIYSEYCNTHPAACAEMQRLMKMGRYKHFFEACRLLQQMIDISIAGFLLTPVQKICKYPLQLGELLKYTPKDHSDYVGVSKAYEAMKNVASLINERKRRLESIDTIAHWQVAILSWEGPNVLERSSELIHSGELNRVVRQGKMQQRSFFLFDHQLVYCKKDVLRRDLLHYRGRLNMDEIKVLDLPDGRDPDLGLSIRNALQLRHTATLEILCILCCRKVEDKQRWLQAFAKERQRVKEDQEMGIEISEEQRKQAIINARRLKNGKIKTAGYASSVPAHHQNPHQNLPPLQQRHVTIPTSVPQQQVFSLAEPKRKPHHLLYSITRNAFFRK